MADPDRLLDRELTLAIERDRAALANATTGLRKAAVAKVAPAVALAGAAKAVQGTANALRVSPGAMVLTAAGLTWMVLDRNKTAPAPEPRPQTAAPASATATAKPARPESGLIKAARERPGMMALAAALAGVALAALLPAARGEGQRLAPSRSWLLAASRKFASVEMTRLTLMAQELVMGLVSGTRGAKSPQPAPTGPAHRTERQAAAARLARLRQRRRRRAARAA